MSGRVVFDGVQKRNVQQNPLVRLNPDQSKYICFTVDVVIEKDRSTVHDVFHVHYGAQNVMIYVPTTI